MFRSLRTSPAHAQIADDDRPGHLRSPPGRGKRPDAPIPGFTSEHSAEQAQAEQRLQRAISANSIGRFSRTLSKRPQLIGSPGNRDAFNFSLATLGRYGLTPDSASYDVYISRPNSVQVTMTAPYRREASNKERASRGRYYDEVVVGYNAYSPSGDVTGELVYANYGLPDDYEALEELGVDLTGKIVTVRYGESFRGVKAKVAEEQGAMGSSSTPIPRTTAS